MNTAKIPLVVRLRERTGVERLHSAEQLELAAGFDFKTGENERGAMVRVMFDHRRQMAEAVHALAKLLEHAMREGIKADNSKRPIRFEIDGRPWTLVMRPSELPDMLRRTADGLAKRNDSFLAVAHAAPPIVVPLAKGIH